MKPLFVRGVAIGVVLFFLAAALRFHRLGDWPFHGDELATQAETAALFDGSSRPVESQIYRLPRLIPLSHLLHQVGYACFGSDEMGSRVVPAALGALGPVVVFWILTGPLGSLQALFTALLLILWPEHVTYSQEGRFYSTAFLFASVAIAAGSLAIERRSTGWTLLACLVALAAIFTHTVAFLLLPGLFLAVFLSRGRSGASLLAVVAAFVVLAGLLYLGYTRPIMGQWNRETRSVYSSVRGLLAAVFRVGWPVVLLSVLGAVLAIRQRGEQDRYWLTWTAIWIGSCVVLPHALPYRPVYSFPLSLGLLVLAAKGINQVYAALAVQSPVLGWAWAGLACCLNLPSLASHYIDGSCTDYRAAAHYIHESYRPGDGAVAVSPDLLQHYLPDDLEAPVLEHPEATAAIDPVTLRPVLDQQDPKAAIALLTRQQARSSRVWVVLSYGRANRPDAVLRWLRQHGSHRLEVCPLRYDYAAFATEVFLLPGEREVESPGVP